MKNVYERTRELAIDEQINKLNLLDKAAHEWGLEDLGTIELHTMQKSCSYAEMLAFYNLYNTAMENDFGFEV